MKPRPHSSTWQTAIADLSLILFLVSAYALESDGGPPRQREVAGPAAAGVPMSVWRAGPDSVPLRTWLAEMAPDDGVMLSATLHYRPGRLGDALRRLDDLRSQLGAHGPDMRVLLQPASSASVEISLRHDRVRVPPGAKIAS